MLLLQYGDDGEGFREVLCEIHGGVAHTEVSHQDCSCALEFVPYKTEVDEEESHSEPGIRIQLFGAADARLCHSFPSESHDELGIGIQFI